MTNTMTEKEARLWKDNEHGYCQTLIRDKGDDNVGRKPEVIAGYLKMQARCAMRDGEYQIAAMLFSASEYVASGIWSRAETAMCVPFAKDTTP